MFPVGSEEVLGSSAEASRIHLDERRIAVENEEFVVIGDCSVCAREEFLDDDPPRPPPIHPLAVRALAVKLGDPAPRDQVESGEWRARARTWG